MFLNFYPSFSLDDPLCHIFTAHICQFLHWRQTSQRQNSSAPNSRRQNGRAKKYRASEPWFSKFFHIPPLQTQKLSTPPQQNHKKDNCKNFVLPTVKKQ